MKILAQHLQHFIDYTQVRGLAPERLAITLAGLPVGWTKENAALSEEDFYKALKMLIHETRDEFLGIRCGQFISLKLLGLIYQISMQVTTVEEAFHYLGSYLNTTIPIITIESNISIERAIVRFTINNSEDDCNRIILENCLTVISKELKMMTVDSLIVELGTPYHHSGYPAGWYMDSNFTVSFSPSILKANLKDTQQLHLDILIPEYLKMVEQLNGGSGFADKVKLTMLCMSDPKLPDIQAIADSLHMTPRTLQRRLAKENRAFREIVDEMKKQICQFLMWHEPYSISGISYILGYSEPASFIHSFKKWYGDSPVKFRKKQKYANWE
ncbi:AraC family transcriptional regulator [Dyadobacter arcticus]|uniref:AraC-like DNA-binding protein n=1 Tax=Dyadobacter arcticus TaxID=1078754 RepID=A0ABX0UHU6_9BACT|nr:AraC family transcriptional regulator [Dyadobacter arcticus]NIJ51594.1 AraC-like DNA-binding protein [Dyadobacter arcticus]